MSRSSYSIPCFSDSSRSKCCCVSEVYCSANGHWPPPTSLRCRNDLAREYATREINGALSGHPREIQSSLTRRGMPPTGSPALKGRATVILPLRGQGLRHSNFTLAPAGSCVHFQIFAMNGKLSWASKTEVSQGRG